MNVDMPFLSNWEKKNITGLTIYVSEFDRFTSSNFFFMIVIASIPVIIGMFISRRIKETG